MFVGRDYTIVTRDLRTLILNLELREECSRAWAGIQYGIGEQQSKRTQSGEQQLKRTQLGSSMQTRSGAAAGGGGRRGAAVEADAAIGPGSSS